MSNETESYHSKLHLLALASMDLADWIYHDVRLDVDGEAVDRTKYRLHQTHELHGSEALYGVGAAWATKTYWRLQDAYHAVDAEVPLLAPNVEIPGDDEEEKRALRSGQQFITAVSNDDLEMAEAIFNAAYDSSLEDAMTMLYSILGTCVRLSEMARRIRGRAFYVKQQRKEQDN